VIAPLLFCLDDLHNYDDLSFRMMKLILKQFSPVMCIGVIRDQYAEGPKPFADKNQKTQEEVVLEGMTGIESVLNSNNLYNVIFRGLCRNDQEDEFLKLIKIRFGIVSF
jgi:adenylate cyclase 10